MKLSEMAELCYMSYRTGKETEYQFCKRLTHHPLLAGCYVACLSEDGLEGFVAVNQFTKHAIVVFRGTDEIDDGWIDIKVCPVANKIGKGKVREGVQNCLYDAWETVLEILEDSGAVSAEFVGHSLGSMLAELACEWLKLDLPEVIITSVTGFGGCPVGDKDFAESASQACGEITHIAGIGDPLPFAASTMLLGYKRTGKTRVFDAHGNEVPVWSLKLWLAGMYYIARYFFTGCPSPHRISEYIRRTNLAEL